MKRLALALTVLVGLSAPAFAKHKHHPFHRSAAGASYSHHHHRQAGGRYAGSGLYVCSGCVVRETKAGRVAVSSANAERIVETINALYDAGFRGSVHCAARPGTHVAGSLHYSGNACDMAQTGWGKTVAMMYHARSIISDHGMRDGCSFRDCGHIDMGFALARRHYHVRYARAHHHNKHYASGV